MRRLLLLPFLLVLALDFVTLEAPLVPVGSRHVEADDEEESVPSRPTRVRREARLVTPALPGQGSVVPPQAPRLPEHIARTARRSDPPPWLRPITHARLSSAGSASPPEDH
jgi:hypothetical protein